MHNGTGRSNDGRNFLCSLVLLSYALLFAAWIVGNPPPSAPDEWSHYLRAVSLGHGQLLGTPSGREGALAIVGAVRPPSLSEKIYEDELAWVGQNTRLVRLPPGLTPGWFRCGHMHHDPRLSAKCLNDSPPLGEGREWFNPTATYQPFPYLLPAAISRIPIDPDNLSRLMRAVKAAVALALLAAAILLLWSPRSRLVSLVGVLVATTPMAVYLAATLNPSGLEIMAALTFASVVLRLTRADVEPLQARWTWTIVAVSGGILALSRTQGPVWMALILAAIVAMSGVKQFLTTSLRHRRPAGVAAAALFAAVVVNRVWEYLYGPTLVFDPTPLVTSISQGLAHLPYVLREQIGVFDYLEFGLPVLAYGIWGALAIALAVTALLVGSARERFFLAAAIAAAVALPVILIATTMRHTGFGLQGRYVLAFSVVVPLMAGEILVRRYDRLQALDAGQLFLPFAAGTTFVQFLAWWTNARRFAVGVSGPRWFLPSAEWTPPGGWWPWATLAAGAACVLLLTPLAGWLLSKRVSNVSGVRLRADLEKSG